MNAAGYQRISEPYRKRPTLWKGILAVNKALTLIGYVAFPLLIALLALSHSPFLLRCLLTAAIGFAVVTAARRILNFPRPYEALDIEPLIVKDTQGKSMPSRHAFSFMMIALCWLGYCVPVGAVMIVLGLVLAACRVLGGVHFLRDVIAGMLFAWFMALAGGFFF